MVDRCSDSEIPSWCYPPENWAVDGLPVEGRPLLGMCLAVDDVSNEVGEIVGKRIRYREETVEVLAGEPLRVAVY